MEDRLAALERAVRRQKYLTSLALALLVAVVAASFQSPGNEADEDGVLRARGLILVDEAGNERILLGAPIPAARNRIRTNRERAREAWAGRFPDPEAYMELYETYDHSTNGMMILDENGHDRLAIGDPTPDLPFGKRIGHATGMVINDHRGFERTGYGLLDVDGTYRVALGLDDDKGAEGVMLMLMDEGPAGILVRHGNQSCFLGGAPADGFGAPSEPFHGLTIKNGGAVVHELSADD